MPSFEETFLTDGTTNVVTFLKLVEGEVHLADDLPNLRLLGDWGRGQRHGLRGRAHSSQQGPHRRHG